MKNFLTLLLILVCTFPLLAQDANPQSENEKSKKIKTEKSVENAKKKKTESIITFETTVHDYGTIYKNDDGTCEFLFTNTGKEDLVLTNVYSSCGCTVPDWPKEPIPKKKSAIIKVKYDTNRIGTINKSITVESNAENGRIILKIKGTVADMPNDAVPPVNTQSPVIISEY